MDDTPKRSCFTTPLRGLCDIGDRHSIATALAAIAAVAVQMGAYERAIILFGSVEGMQSTAR